MQAYNASLASGSDNTVLPVSLLESFSTDNPAPANTTGWFIPSVKELTLLYGFDADDVWSDAYNEGSVTKSLINGILSSWNGDVDVLGNQSYWPSSEYADGEYRTFSVNIDLGRVNLSSKDLSAGYVRAVCAY